MYKPDTLERFSVGLGGELFFGLKPEIDPRAAPERSPVPLSEASHAFPAGVYHVRVHKEAFCSAAVRAIWGPVGASPWGCRRSCCV